MDDNSESTSQVQYSKDLSDAIDQAVGAIPSPDNVGEAVVKSQGMHD